MRLLAYRRVSSVDQGRSGLGLEAQTATVEAYAASQGHEIVEWIEDIGSGTKRAREGYQRALDILERGEADGLVVAKVDRLTRSLLHFAEIVEIARRRDWKLVTIDCLDMTTPSGRAMAGMLAVFSQFERDMISQRTKVALEAAVARGVTLGRPLSVDAATAQRIQARRRSGATLASIAAELNADGVPTSRGGAQWYASTVSKVCLRG